MYRQMVPVNNLQHIETVVKIASSVWNEYYSSILSKGQIDYMLDKFQSAESIKEQIEFGGYQYFILPGNVGYFSIRQDLDSLFLSKFYILKEYRGKGFASAGFDFLDKIALENSLTNIWLTVNKENDNSISIYKHRGYEIVREQVADIGNGYFMDDYIMQKNVKL